MNVVERSWFALAGALWLTGCLAATGCGGSDKLGDVSGVVTLDGQPLAGALVMYSPESGSPSAARTDEQGKYTLEYSSDIKGAEIGKHRVSISTFRAASPDADPPVDRSAEKVPPKYNSATELSETVDRGTNVKNFDLKSAGAIIQPDQRTE